LTPEAFLLPPPVPRLLEVHEVAYALRVSQETVRRLIRTGKLTAVRIGSQWRVDPRDLQAFIDQRRMLSLQIAQGEQDIDRQLESAADELRAVRRDPRKAG
jgi:excisionase family DNA binding protein